MSDHDPKHSPNREMTAPTEAEAEAEVEATAAEATAEESKRSKRERKQVALLSNEYEKIYDDANNRKGKGKPAPQVVKKNDNSKVLQKEITKIITSTTTYQWIGPGTKGSKEDRKADCLYFQKLEIKVGNHPALIQVGDNVLLSRGDTTEADVFDKTTLNRSIHNYSNQNHDLDKSEVAMNSLNPYIGKVISMWEEGAVGKDCSSIVRYKDARRNNMKVLVQWYYNRLDVLRLKGNFAGHSRSFVLSYMRNPRMLLLGAVRDENEVSTVLGKCQVIRNSPEDDPSRISQSLGNIQDERSFLCDFDINITPASSKSGKDKINIVPFKPQTNADGLEKPDNSKEGEEEKQQQQQQQEEEEEGTPPPAKKPRTASTVDSDDNDTMDTTSIIATESVSMEDTPLLNTNKKQDNGEEIFLEEIIKEPYEFKAPTTEGSATQKIMIGENHQAVIPSLAMNRGMHVKTDRDAPPMLIWKPDSISDTKLQTFLDDVKQLLLSTVKNKDIDYIRTVPPDLDPRHLPSSFTCREIKVDQVLKLLHDKAYDADLALKAIKATPQIYLDNWTKREKELYNIGFKRHYNAIRLIAKEIGPTKNHKDVVDYHYRYKIPDQFQRYQDKKRELARRMIDSIDKYRMGDLSLSENPQFVSNSSGSGPKKFHTWARTGGGDSKSIGNIEARRLGAKDFLIVLKDTIGVVKYLQLLNQLKRLHAKAITVPQCRDIFQSELQNHPELLARFDQFLPKEFTDN